jgi:hypothetical protein
VIPPATPNEPATMSRCGVGPARVIATANFDAYGTMLSRRVLHPHSASCVGHKGLMFERLDAGIAEWNTTNPGPNGELTSPTPQLEAGARGLYYVRNRWLDPWRGRWLTSDPNATGQPLCGLWFHSTGEQMSLRRPTLVGSTADGTNLYEYVRTDPINHRDPAGTVALRTPNTLASELR